MSKINSKSYRSNGTDNNMGSTMITYGIVVVMIVVAVAVLLWLPSIAPMLVGMLGL
jgi:hypothetical protein